MRWADGIMGMRRLGRGEGGGLDRVVLGEILGIFPER